jgi:hypothetical protein
VNCKYFPNELLRTLYNYVVANGKITVNDGLGIMCTEATGVSYLNAVFQNLLTEAEGIYKVPGS